MLSNLARATASQSPEPDPLDELGQWDLEFEQACGYLPVGSPVAKARAMAQLGQIRFDPDYSASPSGITAMVLQQQQATEYHGIRFAAYD